MGKLTNQIATEAEAKTVGSASIGITTNLCCIKSRAIALNCKVASNYADNQLVMFSDLSKAWTRPSNLQIYYGLGAGTTGWTVQMKNVSTSWVNLKQATNTGGMITFGKNVVYTTSLINCHYGSNGRYTYPSYVTIEYKYMIDSTAATLGKYKLWREVLTASDTTGTYKSVFNDSVKVFDASGIPENTPNLSDNAVIYAFIYPGEYH